MTKQQENRAFVKMLKEFPKVFGRVSFRERIMLRAAFTYVVEEIVEKEIKQLGERCNQLLKDKGDLTDRLSEEVELHLHTEEYAKSLEKELAEWKEEWQEQVQKAIDEGWERTKLTGRVRELEQQIEKTKCCENCKHKKSEVDRCELLMYTMNACLCKNKDKWELKND